MKRPPITLALSLPVTNKTQIPLTHSTPGLPPPTPVQMFDMGTESDLNPSRQSRTLYIGGITAHANEQNLTDFFNKNMTEMGTGTGGLGNPVLSVQCDYEKGCAFIEVGVGDVSPTVSILTALHTVPIC